jgi:hypothetical protein
MGEIIMGKTIPLNFQNLIELNTTPGATTATWARIASGISSFTPSNNENVDQTAYLDGDGFGSSDVIGMQKTYAFSGHRVVGDTAQDYIFNDLQETLGDNRKTQIRHTDANGKIITGDCTVCNIVEGGGDANAKTEISFEVHINGKPEKTPATTAPELTATIAAGATVGTTTATATAGTGDTLAYCLRSSALSPNGGAYIFGLTSYTSEAEIKASVGQVLNLFELDANSRVVKFVAHELVTADIKA